MTAPIMEGAEPQSWPGGPNGVLVIHGFTGNPQSLRPLAQRLADAGYSVELPLLPGHGTAIEDMLDTTWDDWSGAAEAAYLELAGRTEKVVLAALSMGGAIAVWLAARHPEIAGMILVNPATMPPVDETVEIMRGLAEAGTEIIPGIGSDIAKEGNKELAYPGTPVRALVSLLETAPLLDTLLPEVRCPILLMNSPQDHVVPPAASDYLAEKVSGPVERVSLDRSYHVATLDHDQEQIETRALEFAEKIFAS